MWRSPPWVPGKPFQGWKGVPPGVESRPSLSVVPSPRGIGDVLQVVYTVQIRSNCNFNFYTFVPRFSSIKEGSVVSSENHQTTQNHWHHYHEPDSNPALVIMVRDSDQYLDKTNGWTVSHQYITVHYSPLNFRLRLRLGVCRWLSPR